MPMPAITIRSLGAGRPSFPSAEAGMTQGKAARAADAFKKARRLTGEPDEFWIVRIFIGLFLYRNSESLVHFLQRCFRFFPKFDIIRFVEHPLQSLLGDRRFTSGQSFGDLFVSRE